MNARCFVLGCMWTAMSVGFVAATEPPVGEVAANGANSPRRSLSAIQVDVHNALRAEASSRRLGPNAAEVLRLVGLYREISAHPKRHDSPLLQHLGSQVRSRLKTVSDRIERQITQREKRAKKPEQLPAAARSETHVLAQQFGAAGAGQGAPPAAPPSGATGGIDYGTELVDIIQQAISPATWNINGGLGAIVYFAPLRVIVVSAPTTVHDQIGDVLGQLRAAP